MPWFVARAAAVRALPDLAVKVVVLAEDPRGSGKRLELQRSLETDERDEALGLDTCCLVVESGATHYGGIRAWRIVDRCLLLRLDERAAAGLGAPSDLKIDLFLDDAVSAAVEEGIREVLKMEPVSGGSSGC